jgi:hypothetical protein
MPRALEIWARRSAARLPAPQQPHQDPDGGQECNDAEGPVETPDHVFDRAQFCPSLAPRKVSPPYQSPDAMAIGTRVRTGPRRMRPAKGAVKERNPAGAR